MSTIMERSLETLACFDEICKKNNLEYWLAPSMAAAAKFINQPLDNQVNIAVVMKVDACKKFIQFMEETGVEGYEIEYPGNNINYRYMTISFVNENTTFIDLKQGDNTLKYGIKVNIIPLRSEKRSKIEGYLELGWECNGYRATYKQTKKRASAIKTVKALCAVNKKKFIEGLWKQVLSDYSKKEERYVFRKFKRKKKYFDKTLFDATDYILFGDKEYPVPRELQAYLEVQLGADWEEKIEQRKLRSGIIVLPDIPYKAYIERLESKGINLQEVWDIERNNIENREEILDEIKEKNKAWRIANRSGDRLELLEELQPQMEKIRELYEQQNFEELAVILERNQERTEHYMASNLGFAVNEEILKIQCDLYRYNEREAFAEKLMRKVPVEHYKSIKEEV